MHELFQISFAARIAMLTANFLIFFILANHARNRLIAQEGTRVFWLVLSFAGVSFATSCLQLWSAIITSTFLHGKPQPELMVSNVVTICSALMLIFAVPLIRVLTLPTRTVWFGTALIFLSAITSYIWAGKQL